MLPAAVGVQLDLDHRDAVRVPATCAPSRRVQVVDAVGVQQAVVGVLVVHHQQAAVALPSEREEVHAVVVHADLRACSAAVLEASAGRPASRRTGRPARPTARRLRRRSPRARPRGRRADRHARTPASSVGPLGRWRSRPAGREQRGGRRSGGSLQHDAPARVAQFADVGLVGGVAVLHRLVGLGHLLFSFLGRGRIAES